jgi:hypothetical protein
VQSEDQLREKLRKIEALYAGAATAGEKSAAGAAADRIRLRFERSSREESSDEFKFSIADPWSRQLFIALCRRYGIKPYRYTRMHRQTVIVRVPPSFVHNVLSPEFEELNRALTAHLDAVTNTIICEEIHSATADADEISEPRHLL